MKQHSLRQSSIHIFLLVLIMSIVGVSMISFKNEQLYTDFLKQLGLSKAEANEKITNSLLSGALDPNGIRNLKNIVLNDRAAIVKDVSAYAKQYAGSPEFIKQYLALKEENRPEAMKIETPDELRINTIRRAREAVKEMEESLKKAPSDMKSIFEKTLEAAKQNLKTTEDPDNKYMKSYAQNFASLQQQMKQSHENALKSWEAKYPSNHLLFIKVRLQEFLDATKDVDFAAQVTERNGIKYFVSKDYERKDNRWKMAFRAGKPAIEAARAFAEEWLSEIK
jgi:hypothetical protein